MSSRWVIIEERDSGVSGVLFLTALLVFGAVVVLVGAIVLPFLAMYAPVSWVADRVSGPDPEPSPTFWERTKLWAKRVDEASCQ